MGMGVLDVIDPAAYPPRPRPCPRCGVPAELRFAGPCPTCVAELRARMQGAARDIGAADYDPKMNVTPNAVAQKDD